MTSKILKILKLANMEENKIIAENDIPLEVIIVKFDRWKVKPKSFKLSNEDEI